LDNMKYAIVNKSDLQILGFYEAEAPTTNIPWWGNYILAAHEHVHLEVGNLVSDCLRAILIEDVITLIEDPVLVAAKATAAKAQQVAEINAAMNADIDAQMFITYETKDRVTANAIQQSWADISAAPSEYTSVFPSANAAAAYANAKLAAARAFNIWRIGRVAQRDAAIAAL
jgi:hypothetical protein